MALPSLPTVPTAVSPSPAAPGDRAARGRTTWARRDWWRAALLLGVVALMHAVAFGVLFLLVVPAHYQLGDRVFGLGLGLTAYTFGMRHAFDADHIAAIDNTTRKLMTDGKRPVSVGFWFAMGHSSLVFLLAGLVGVGAHVVDTLTGETSPVHRVLGIVGTSLSGTFLYVIAALNLVALVSVVGIYRRMRQGTFDEDELETALNSRGLLSRMLGRFTRAIHSPVQMFPVGILFGLGFDTATEVALLVLAGAGAAGGLPWYAVLLLPLLFACGMSLLDTLDGLFMNFAYDWAFAHPARRVFYNMSVTALSVAVAFLIGTIELVTVLHDQLHLTDPVSGWISSLSLNNVGFAVVGLFVAVWATAIAYWKLARVEDRWALAVTVEPE